MKGYCDCGKEIDETEFTQWGSCFDCYEKKNTIVVGGEAWERYFRSKPKPLNPDESKRYWEF